MRTGVRDRPERSARFPLSAWIALLLAAGTWLVFADVVHFGYVTWDDGPYVTDNAHVRQGLTWPGIVWAFTAPTPPYWHPLTWLSHMLDVQLFGLDPAGHHLTSLLIHIASTLMLFGLLARATRAVWPSAFVSAMFAVHPLHVESVAWIAERKDVLSTLLGLLAMGAYVRYSRHPTLLRYSLVVVMFAAGLMAKPMLVMLPIVLGLLDVWPLGRVGSVRPRTLALEKLPLLALAAVSAMATFVVQAQVGAVGHVPPGLRAANALTSYVSYIGQLVWPSRLAALYPYPETAPLWWPLALALLAAASVAAWRARVRRPWVFVGWFWYVVTLLPVIGIVQVGEQARADRFTYLPLVGLLIVAAWEVPRLLEHRPAAARWLPAGAVIVLVACGVTARAQTQHWASGLALWQHAVDVTDDNAYAHSALGAELADAGRRAEALAHEREALRIRPFDPEAHNELGKLLAEEGQHDAAVEHFRQAVARRPEFAEAQHNLGTALLDLDRADEAVGPLREAVRLRPDRAGSEYALGRAEARRGNLDGAVEHLSRALALDAGLTPAQMLLGSALAARGRTDEAIAQFEQVIASRPPSADADYRLALLYRQRGRIAEAVRVLRDGLERDGSHAPARALLAELTGR